MKYLGIVLGILMMNAYALQKDYNEGTNYAARGVSLGKPNANFLGHTQDTTKLQNHNDTTIAAKGGDALQDKNSPQSLLAPSATNAINARGQYQINSKNKLIKGSLDIEKNPLAQTGGKEMAKKSTLTKETKHTCTDGIKFNVDVIRQLTFVPPPKTIMKKTLSVYIRRKDVAFYKNQVNPFKAGKISSFSVTNVADDVKYIIDNKKHKNLSQSIILYPHHPHPSIVCGGSWMLCGVCDDIYNSSNRRNHFYRPSSRQRMFLARYLKICASRMTINYDEVIYQHSSKYKEYWGVINASNEKLVEENNCHEVKRQCLDSGVKHINGYKASRKCWKEKISYQCQSQPIEGCKYPKEQNCTLRKSSCIKKQGNLCLQYKRDYLCRAKEEIINPGLTGTKIFCLGGDCYTPKFTKNNDMNNAVSRLAIFKEMQKQMIPGRPPTVFKGQHLACAKHMLSFINCCSSMDGWGKSLGLSSCNETEKTLAKLRKQRVCHYVGTYCAERFPVIGVCIRKKSTYCCFDSKLSRIFHEQGRGQINKSWGSAESPNCSAFSVDELCKIDFSKINLSEIFSDIFKGLKQRLKKAFPRQIKNQMPKLQKQKDGFIKRNNQYRGGRSRHDVNKTTY